MYYNLIIACFKWKICFIIWRIILNEVYISDKTLPVLYDCDFRTAPTPFYHADRLMDFHVLIYVTSGVIYVTEGDTDYEVGAGGLLFLKSGIRHFGKHEIPKGTGWYFAHFAADTDESLPPFSGGAHIGYDYRESALMLPKVLSLPARNAVRDSFAALVDGFQSDDARTRWRLNSMLFDLLCEIGFYTDSEVREPSLSDRICKALFEQINEPFSAERLERRFFLSYKRMAAVFKKEKRITMQQYHSSLKMNAAARLLRTTLLPVGEIADGLGFNDKLYFSKCFTKFFGISPTQYRRENGRC